MAEVQIETELTSREKRSSALNDVANLRVYKVVSRWAYPEKSRLAQRYTLKDYQ
jgi:hypothetical protein